MGTLVKSLPKVPTKGTVSAEAIAKIEQDVIASVLEIADPTALNEYREQMAALEKYLRGKDLQKPILGAERRVEARIGQLLKPKQGQRNDLQLVNHDLQVPKQILSDFRILARGFEKKAELTEEEWRKSRRALVALLRQRLGLIPDLPELPKGIFRCIVADPPWQQDTGPDTFGGTGESGHDSLAYPTMSVEAISAIDVEAQAAGDAHLYLWTTNKYLEAAFGIAKAWGFKPSVVLTWCKTPRGVGLGDAFKLTTEFCIYARRGKLKELQATNTTWFNWPRGKHSKKPDEFYEMVESMTPAPHQEKDRLEMFARQPRKGWTVMGNEVENE